MNNDQLVSIIIVNYNGKKFLEKCLETLVKVDYPSNTLTLARKITFKAGDPVNLPFAGKAPDIGPYESGLNSSGSGAAVARAGR